MEQEWNKHHSDRIDKRRIDGHLRSLTSTDGVIDFSSNDYLGWRHYPTHSQDVLCGSTGSRLISGNDQRMLDIERDLAVFHGSPRFLFMANGYVANIALITALCDRHTTLIIDEYVHASVHDGIRVALIKEVVKFRHNHLNDLEAKLQGIKGPKVICVESIYSMDGDEADIGRILKLCDQYDAMLIVDEAHALGVKGDEGRGLSHVWREHPRLIARLFTYGKAFCAHGAGIACHDLVFDLLVNYGRSFIYSTAPPLHQLQWVKSQYERLLLASSDLAKLHARIQNFVSRIPEQSAWKWSHNDTPIQWIMHEDTNQLKRLANVLLECGMYVKVILPPTVPSGLQRIRISLRADHSEADIDFLFQTIYKFDQANG